MKKKSRNQQQNFNNFGEPFYPNQQQFYNPQYLQQPINQAQWVANQNYQQQMEAYYNYWNQYHNQEQCAIEINNVSKLFGNDGIAGLSFKVYKGSFHVLIGSNGAGKTTLIRTILNLYQRYSGEILINGQNSQNPESLGQISYISEHSLFPNEFNGRKYLQWVGLLAGHKINYINAMIRDLAIKFDVQNILNKNPNKLSSGQKQKLLLMKLLIEAGDVIILDEPTANLDPAARIIFFEEIKNLHHQGKTIFVCSHNLEEIEDKATWVTILDKGRVVYDNEHEDESLSYLFKKYVLYKDNFAKYEALNYDYY